MSKKVILESPFKNQNRSIFIDNYLYVNVCARKIMNESDTSVLFFHTLYTQFLDDNNDEERKRGLYRSFEFHSDAEEKVYALDRGISEGMILGGEDAIEKGMPVKFYTALPENSDIANRVKEINSIEDNRTRWESGLRFVEDLKSSPEHGKRFSINGDLTNYKPHVQKNLESVKDCLLNFFEPITKELKKEKARVNEPSI